MRDPARAGGNAKRVEPPPWSLSQTWSLSQAWGLSQAWDLRKTLPLREPAHEFGLDSGQLQ